MPATEKAPDVESKAVADNADATTAAKVAAVDVTAAPAETVEYPVLLHTVVVRDAAAALLWYARALGGDVAARHLDAQGRVLHAVVRTHWGLVLGVEDHLPETHVVSPVTEGEGSGDDKPSAPGCSYAFVTVPAGYGSADSMVERMREAGATVVSEPRDRFYGQRVGQVVDMFGVCWVFAHSIEKKEGTSDGKKSDGKK